MLTSGDRGGWTPLQYAVDYAQMEMMALLIEQGADINAEVNHSWYGNITPLWIAVYNGDWASMNYLLELGAVKQETPSLLLAATFSGDWELFEFLLQNVPDPIDWERIWEEALRRDNQQVVRYMVETKQIDINKRIGKYNSLPLELITQNKDLQGDPAIVNWQILIYLLEKGADPKLIHQGDVIEWSMENSNPETFDLFMEMGFSFREYNVLSHYQPYIYALDCHNFHAARYLLQQVEGEPMTYSSLSYPLILYYANETREWIRKVYPILEFLVKEKINTPYYSSAFYRCVYYNDFESVALFLANGVDINTKNSKGQNALWYAGDPEMAEYLIRRGIDVFIPLVYEGELIDMSVLSVFLKYGIPVPLSQEYLDDALCIAARLGNDKMVEYFLSEGADVNAGREKTPLMENASKGYERPSHDRSRKVSPKVIKQLIKAGADINAEDENGDTALMHALRNYEYDDKEYRGRTSWHTEWYPYPVQDYSLIIQELLRAGADVNKHNKNGETPLTLAIEHEHTELIPLLEAYKAEK